MTALSAEQLAEVVRAVKEGLHEEKKSFKRGMSEDREAGDEEDEVGESPNIQEDAQEAVPFQ